MFLGLFYFLIDPALLTNKANLKAFKGRSTKYYRYYERRENMEYNPCITIDVSQGKSHFQGFIGYNNKNRRPDNLTQPKVMRHSKQGFEKLLELISIIKSKTNMIPLVIFEYTGIYHKTLEKFLQEKNIQYHIIAPLRAAKSRQNDIRSVKTDKRDCLSLARMFYDVKNDSLGKFNAESESYESMKQLNRFYENILLRQQELKVNFREALAVIYPNYKISNSNPNGAFKNVYSSESLGFLKEFPHPDLVVNKSIDEIEEKLIKYLGKAHYKYSFSIASNLLDYCKDLVPGCSVNQPLVNNMKFYISQIELYDILLNNTLKQLIALAKNSSLYNLLLSIPCVKENLASRFIAEIGDINRFNSYKAIISFVGNDPKIYQSGDNLGLHKKITKKGNKHLRTIIYLIVQQMTKAKNIDSSIKSFYKKKTQQGLSKLAALIACCNKLIRIIYYLNKTGCAFHST